MILSCQWDQYGHIETLNINIGHPMAEIIFSFVFDYQGGSGATCKWSYHVGQIDRLFRHLKYQKLSTDDHFSYINGIICLVPFLATREAEALLANGLIMLGKLILSLKHLESQNLSIISDSKNWARCGNNSRTEQQNTRTKWRNMGIKWQNAVIEW